MHRLRFRQVHLDFHTSEHIPNVGSKFNKHQFQYAIEIGKVNSITCFAKCHHGFSYYNTQIGQRHPNLNFDLLRAQFDAAKEIGVIVPIYLSAGVDNLASKNNPQWREISIAGIIVPPFNKPGFHNMCFNSPYLDYLCSQIKEVISLFPDADGIFLDIVSQGLCCCKYCQEKMKENELEVQNEEDRRKCAKLALEKYYQQTTAACKSKRLDMPVFHNSGNIQRGNREILKYFTHLELESLPTGGWGYDHFPISAKYCKNLPFDFLGMTGKFHTTWGEFGGFKHPNALKYECAAMLAYGAKCNIGDQLHPEAMMDVSTYKLIGSAYEEVEAKEGYCTGTENIADIAILSVTSVNGIEKVGIQDEGTDIGAGRILLESHILFDIIDKDMNFSKYKLLILPDNVKITPDLKEKLDHYIENNGRIFLSGNSGLAEDGSGFLFDIGAKWYGKSEYQIDYILSNKSIRPSFIDSPLVMYFPSQRIKVSSGKSLGKIYDPYFNRSHKHFCSHQHTPACHEPSGFDCGVINGNILYLAHPVFSIYYRLGAVAYKEYISNAIGAILGKKRIAVSLPSSGRVTLMHQKEHDRFILHLLYANTIARGGEINFVNETHSNKIEIIDELNFLSDIKVSLRLPFNFNSVTCVPQNEDLDFSSIEEGIEFTLPLLRCHQMIELKY